MRSVRGALLLLSLFALAAPLHAQEDDVAPPEQYFLRLDFRYFQPTLDGTIQNSGATQIGTILDYTRDLGVEEDKRTWIGRGIIQFMSGHKIKGFYTPIEREGAKSAADAFLYGESRFLRGSFVSTSVKGQYIGGEYEWDFLQRPEGFLGAVAGARYFDVDTVLASTGVNDIVTHQVTLPVIGLAGRLYFGAFSAEVEVIGLSTSHGKVIEGDFTARFHVSDRLAIMGGYRSVNFNSDSNGDAIEYNTKGWQLGAELSL